MTYKEKFLDIYNNFVKSIGIKHYSLCDHPEPECIQIYEGCDPDVIPGKIYLKDEEDRFYLRFTLNDGRNISTAIFKDEFTTRELRQHFQYLIKELDDFDKPPVLCEWCKTYPCSECITLC